MDKSDLEDSQVDLAEMRRQARVLTSGVLGMRGDSELSSIVQRAATITDFPFAAVSIVDRSRLWLATAYGFDPREFKRPDSFCDAAIKVQDFAPLCVPDAWQERRFMFAPAVIEMNVRAYYAASLVTTDGLALGTLCLLDQKPRTVDAETLDTLRTLASDASRIIETERNVLAYAQYAITELCSRIRLAVADGNDAQAALLDEELRRLEKKLQPNWR